MIPSMHWEKGIPGWLVHCNLANLQQRLPSLHWNPMSRVQCHGSAPAMSGMQMPQGGWLSNVPCCCQPEVGSPMSPSWTAGDAWAVYSVHTVHWQVSQSLLLHTLHWLQSAQCAQCTPWWTAGEAGTLQGLLLPDSGLVAFHLHCTLLHYTNLLFVAMQRIAPNFYCTELVCTAGDWIGCSACLPVMERSQPESHHCLPRVNAASKCNQQCDCQYLV